jgi:hypothetical protein
MHVSLHDTRTLGQRKDPRVLAPLHKCDKAPVVVYKTTHTHTMCNEPPPGSPLTSVNTVVVSCAFRLPFTTACLYTNKHSEANKAPHAEDIIPHMPRLAA